ncbi:pantoate--beta-alanine ligase [Candidatus Marinamargulisbacteria bacterium SCGC AAA071-K20]|nr:pantoate--beta-alanine ligase [Candidatus Marinamargulisbacteria bacterium SCGC AAA071-K20]
MKTIHAPIQLQALLSEKRSTNQTIGFVPTMGALHQGHLSLVKQSLSNCDITVVSIFVNPTQFAPNEDFDAYPRPQKEDSENLSKLGVDILFMPSSKEIYPTPLDRTTQVIVPILSHLYCAESRPTIFTGASTVLCRLLTIVQATQAFFGEKDFQQYRIIKQMTKDLFIPTQIMSCQIVREENGLAMSSRNRYFSDLEKSQASIIYESLNLAVNSFKDGEHTASTLETLIRDKVKEIDAIKVAYIAFVNPVTFEKVETVCPKDRILFAGDFNTVRLIDNMEF